MSADSDTISVRCGERSVILRRDNAPYARDVIEHFDFYWRSVEGTETGVADFSAPADHHLVGFDLFPVAIPGLPEPMATVEQYIELTGLERGMHVLDLGAYAGVSSMTFLERVGRQGAVLAVEADPGNLTCLKRNFERYEAIRGYAPALAEAAAWDTAGHVLFTAEGNLGSAVSAVATRPGSVWVPSVTLSQLVAEFAPSRVDVIKADIEGAEYRAFSDSAFFRHHHPTLIFEPASTRQDETRLELIGQLLEGYGYTLEVVDQAGSRLPLVIAR